VLALTVGVAGQLSLFVRIATDDDLQVEVSDFGRDTIGVAAIREGRQPYRTLGELDPERFGGTEFAEWWVAHPPTALAATRAASAILGDRSEDVVRWLTIVATVALGATLGLVMRRRGFMALAVGASVVMWFPALEDAGWVQVNAAVGLALLAVLLLDQAGWRRSSRALLGIITAVKLWPAVFALALPRSRSVTRDVAAVGGVAAIVTGVVLPWVGGIETLLAWPAALLGNLTESRAYSMSVSLLPEGGGTIAVAVVLLVAAALREKVPRPGWPFIAGVLYVSLAPLSWGHYLPLVAVASGWLLARKTSFRALSAVAVGWVLILAAPALLRYVGTLPGPYRSPYQQAVVTVLLVAVVLALAVDLSGLLGGSGAAREPRGALEDGSALTAGDQ
jgi:hypothetical protein